MSVAQRFGRAVGCNDHRKPTMAFLNGMTADEIEKNMDGVLDRIETDKLWAQWGINSNCPRRRRSVLRRLLQQAINQERR